MAATSTLDADLPWAPARPAPADGLALVIAWSLDEPERVAESLLVHAPLVLGRGEADEGETARFAAWRPQASGPAAPLASPRISRAQLKLEPDGDVLHVENLGRCTLLVNGEERTEAEVRPGDTLTLRNTLVLLVARRTPPPAAALDTHFRFGGPDAYGMVGESAVAWRLRAALGFASASGHHVLITGPSGVGKELAAKAVHAMSSRARRPMLSRNAATFPDSLVDAEIFGSARNYPNVGSAERLGLVGEADGTSLFLDEIGELAPTLQAHLLRVLDADGEYHRLGESRPRRADVRLIAATNRPTDALKHDFAARFTARVEVPGLHERREDIPLLIAAALARAAENPAIRERFFDSAGRPRIHPMLVEALVRHRYTHHARELERLLWRAIGTSSGDFVGLNPAVEAELSFEARPIAVVPTREAIEAALSQAGGRAVLAAEALGLPSRYALYRLMKKFGIEHS